MYKHADLHSVPHYSHKMTRWPPGHVGLPCQYWSVGLCFGFSETLKRIAWRLIEPYVISWPSHACMGTHTCVYHIQTQKHMHAHAHTHTGQSLHIYMKLSFNLLFGYSLGPSWRLASSLGICHNAVGVHLVSSSLLVFVSTCLPFVLLVTPCTHEDALIGPLSLCLVSSRNPIRIWRQLWTFLLLQWQRLHDSPLLSKPVVPVPTQSPACSLDMKR